MEIKELRIGNYISPLGIGFTKVEGFCIWDDLIQSSNFAERGIEDFEPIPITEEWLLKFGFIYNGWNYDFERYVFHAQGKNEKLEFYNTEFGIRKNKEVFNISYKIDYVHQLQNLYFALTGKELEIK